MAETEARCAMRRADTQEIFASGGSVNVSVNGGHMKTRALVLWLGLVAVQALGTPVFKAPTICSVVNALQFESILQMTQSPATCGFPPRPCVQFSYYVPKYFIEVVYHAKETFFGVLPGVRAQLSAMPPRLPFAAEDDNESYSYHAHTISIPLTQWRFKGCLVEVG